MRILYVSYNHPSITPGGEQQIAYELFQASLALGHEAYLISALEVDQEGAYGKPGAPIVPLHGEARQFLYFPQNFDYVHLSVGDWRSIQFFREFVERINPEVVHFHHYHRVGVESIRAARVAAPQAAICLTFHEMMAICMADGQMLKRPSRQLCHAASPLACNKCFPDLRPEFRHPARQPYEGDIGGMRLFFLPLDLFGQALPRLGADGQKMRRDPQRAGSSIARL